MLSSAEVIAQLMELMPAWRQDKVTRVSFLEGGYSNLNYRVTYMDQDYVMRVPQTRQPYVDRIHEHAWYGTLARKEPGGKWFLHPLAYDVQSGRMLSKWVQGNLLVDVLPTLPANELGNLLGRYVLDLHRNLPDPGRTYDVNTLADIYVPGHAYTSAGTDVTLACHNDLNPWNVLVCEDRWITLDWEFVGRHDPLFDLIALHQGAELDMAVLRAMLDAYNPALLEDTERISANLKNFWLREWSWAKFQLSRGNERAEIYAQAAQAEARLQEL